jgi:tetrahydromethanopterin S-methyltransferase subunit G
MEEDITTIEDWAAMIQRAMASKEDIQGVNVRLDNLDARVGRIEADVHALRDEVVRRREFEDVLDRVKYIEKKLGIESGV